MSTTITRERPDTPDSIQLLKELDALLEQMPYPRESRHAFSVEQLIKEEVVFFVTRFDGLPAGCGGIKLFSTDYGEIKRMYVQPRFRGRGLGKLMLDRLEEYARGHQVPLLRLETGIHQPEAIGLYERFGFQRCQPFGEYRVDPMTLYFEKRVG